MTTRSIQSRPAMVLGALLLALAGGESASASRPTTLVVAPLSELGISEAETARVQRWLQAAMIDVPGYRLLSGARLRRFMRSRPECEVDHGCLGAAARAAGAQAIVAGDVGLLGGGYIVYLRLVSRAGQQLRSVSGVLAPEGGELRAEVRGLAFQLLAPHRYTGTLLVEVDVPDAWIYLDGRRVAKSPVDGLPVSVGTHALRVTQEAHRDFVRFVQVDFEQETRVAVKLDPVPVSSRRMKLASQVRVMRDAELPWYRRWWALAGAGAALTAATAVVVALIPRGVAADREVIVSRP